MTQADAPVVATPESGDAPDRAFPLLGLGFHVRRALVVALQLLLVAVSYWLAFALRFDFRIPPSDLITFWTTLAPLLLMRASAFAYYQLYSGWWRYVGMRDLYALLKAVLSSSILFAAALVLLGRALAFPRSVIAIDAVLTMMMIGGARFTLRALRESRRPRADGMRKRRVLIIGAGDAGELLLREIQNNPRLGYEPVGFVDDDPRKTGFQIHGVAVIGLTANLAGVLAAHPADELIIAIPSASRETIQAIVNRCLALRLPFKILPAIAALSGRVLVSQLRPVRVEDLLGRDPVELDSQVVRVDITGRRVLITGGGGSIGAELARQVATFDPAEIALVDRSENSLYLIEQELRRRHPNLSVRAVLCDVRDSADIRAVLPRGAPAGRVPRGRVQARAAHGGPPPARRAQQRVRHADHRLGGGGAWREVRDGEHRQGRESEQRDGCDEAARREDRALAESQRRAAFRRRAIRQRTREQWVGGAAVREPDR